MTDPTSPSSDLKERAALEALLLGNAARTADVVNDDRGPRPLSPGQESLWFLGQLSPTLPVYNVPQAFSIRGPLNVLAFERAVLELVGRHDALRTRIIVQEQKPFQELWPIERFALKIEDLTAASPAARSSILKGIVQGDATTPFDLTQEPLLRTKLFKIGVEEHVFAMTVHHIISDMWSLGIFYEELNAAYRSFAENQSPSLPTAPSFQSFAAQQSRTLRNGNAENAIAYWRETLGSTPILELPIDYPRPREPRFKGALHWFHVAKHATEHLVDLSRKNNSSLYMTLLAAFQVLLQRYSRQNEFVIGTPFSQRDFPDAERMVGYMINMLALRADCGGNPNFQDLLQRVRKASLAAYEHQNVPFSRIVEELRTNREPGQNPLCQVVFQYLPNGLAKLELAGTSTEAITIDTGTSKFDLTLTLASEGDHLIAEIEYNTDLFQQGTIERMSGHFIELLTAIGEEPAARIADLPLLTEAERTLLLVDWNQTESAYPKSATIAQLFEQQAAQNPEATALTSVGGTVSYAELNRCANRLSHRLIKCGVRPGDPVGVCLERSFELVVALIAILKAGGAYVPFDSNYPPDRLAYMFKDSGVRILLANEQSGHLGDEQVQKIMVGQIIPSDDEGLENPSNSASSEALAYIIYTSGSTGMPKGVAVPNRAVVRLVKNTNFASFSTNEVFLQFAPISFDASTLELWGPLLNGATLAIYPPSFDSIEQFEQLLEQFHVSTLWLTAGLFNFIVDHNVQSLRSVRQLLIGGDVLSVQHVKNALATLPNTQIINGYGPTENTTFTCCYTIPKSFNGIRPVPIGRPISNTRVYIVDENLGPVPIGVAGELLTGGDGLALGYWNQPELTAQKFVPNPFATNSGEKLYRTGDLARYLPEGTIEFLGRIDGQVKIRGFRIELGEVEAALNKLPNIQDAVVVARREEGGVNSLAAYVVPIPGAQVDLSALRHEVARTLPAHMVPTYFVTLDKLPLNANGKVDRANLPVPNPKDSEEIAVLPGNGIEQQLADIWKEVLSLPQVGVTDNFFELGGHSLLATRVISRVNRAFNSNLSLAALFQAPTIRMLANLIANDVHPSGPIANRATDTGASALLGRLDEMSDAEVDALLQNMLPAK